MIDITIEIPLIPIGKGRPKSGRTKSGCTVVYTPEKTRTWEATFAELAAQQLPRTVIEDAVRVDILAVIPRPKRLLRRADPEGIVRAPHKPDKDNIDKAVFDALCAHWRDDAQVVIGTTIKAYAEKNGVPRTVVRIRSVEDSDLIWEAMMLGLLRVTS